MAEDDAAQSREQSAGASDEAIQSSDSAAEHMRFLGTAIQTSLYAGPIPPADELARYETALPGAADRILKMAESQQAHRQEAEMTVIRNDAGDSKDGIRGGVIVALAALAVAGIFAVQGHPWFGIAAVLAPITALASVFVYGTHSRNKERRVRLADTLSPTVDVAEPPVEQPPSGPQLPRK